MNQHLERLEQLAPILRYPAQRFIDQVFVKHGLILLVVWTYRSLAKQMEIYAKGREYDHDAKRWTIVDATQLVTNALPGRTSHNVITGEGVPASLALDIIPLNDEEQPEWNTPSAHWSQMYEIAADCGLDPYGDAWGASLPKDKGHFEEPGWKYKLDALGLRLPEWRP